MRMCVAIYVAGVAARLWAPSMIDLIDLSGSFPNSSFWGAMVMAQWGDEAMAGSQTCLPHNTTN